MAYLNTEHTTIEKFAAWLDATPPYTWEIVEKAAQLYSMAPQRGTIGISSHMGGMCRALHIMSGYPMDVITRFVRDFAIDNYEYGERIY